MKYSPASSCSVPLNSAKSEDLPAPLRPTRPTFSVGLMVTLAASSSTLAPRRRVRFLRVIKEIGFGWFLFEIVIPELIRHPVPCVHWKSGLDPQMLTIFIPDLI